jgi:glycosyltransferase involved in cell wall biosynthesis
MQILIITAVFRPEPVVSAKLSYDLASELSLSNKVTVISPKPTRPFGFKFELARKKENFDHIVSDSYVCPQSKHFGRLRESFSFGRFCYNFISENFKSIDLIYANTWPLFAQYFVIRAAERHNIPVILHVQDIYPESLMKKLSPVSSVINAVFLPLDKYILRKSKKIIAISDKMAFHLIKTRRLNSSKVQVIPNWQDETTFNITGNFCKDQLFTFMYLGNIGPVANVGLLIDAFIIAGLKRSRLVIAGSGSMKSAAMKKAEAWPEAMIEFWEVPGGEVDKIQSKADVMLLPLNKDAASSSVPSKLIAYMFSGKPIIASVDENSDTSDTISNAECGWIVKSNDEKELASKMKYTLSLGTETLQNIGTNGRKYALQNYSKQFNLPKIVLLIERMLIN